MRITVFKKRNGFDPISSCLSYTEDGKIASPAVIFHGINSVFLFDIAEFFQSVLTLRYSSSRILLGEPEFF